MFIGVLGDTDETRIAVKYLKNQGYEHLNLKDLTNGKKEAGPEHRRKSKKELAAIKTPLEKLTHKIFAALEEGVFLRHVFTEITENGLAAFNREIGGMDLIVLEPDLRAKYQEAVRAGVAKGKSYSAFIGEERKRMIANPLAQKAEKIQYVSQDGLRAKLSELVR